MAERAQVLYCWLHCQQAPCTVFCKTVSLFNNQFPINKILTMIGGFLFCFTKFVGFFVGLLKMIKHVEIWYVNNKSDYACNTKWTSSSSSNRVSEQNIKPHPTLLNKNLHFSKIQWFFCHLKAWEALA